MNVMHDHHILVISYQYISIDPFTAFTNNSAGSNNGPHRFSRLNLEEKRTQVLIKKTYMNCVPL